MNRSWIEVDLKAIAYNLTQVKKKIGKDNILACIKADAYAHGAISVAQTIEKKVDFFGVATVSEAKELREAGIKKSILILGTILPEEASAVVKNNLSATVCTILLTEALSKEAKIALARGSAAAQTATCSGEGGILPESLESSYRYIFEYVPNQYSVTDEYLQKVDAIEIKLGQSAKPGMGGHLPGVKVTKEIADIRGFPEGSDIISPPFFSDIKSLDELRQTVDNLRQRSGGRPVGVKIAAGHIEDDLEIIALADPDFITIDGRAGGTGAAPKFVKASASIPTIFALHRARACLDKIGKTDVQLIITGGLRISPDFAKALAMGADAIALGTSALMALGCQQYRQCHLGTCPMGITSQDPDLRRRLDIDGAAQKLARFLSTSTEELKTFARLTGKRNIHDLSVTDICTTNSEISGHTAIEHV